MLGIVAIGVIWFFANVTRTDQHNYNLLKETTEAAMFDALDLAAYRKDGTIRIEEEKFVENFIRRFAENADLSNTYVIEIYDVNETPPKVSLKVSSTRKENILKPDSTSETFEFDIVNKIDAILETKYELYMQMSELCTLLSDSDSSGTVTVGDKYNCKVSSTEEYEFYVINASEATVSLIMSQNLNNNKGLDNSKENKKEQDLIALTQNWDDIDVRLPSLADIKGCKPNVEKIKNSPERTQHIGYKPGNAEDYNYYYDFSDKEWIYGGLIGSVTNGNKTPLAYWITDIDYYGGQSNGACMYHDGKLWFGADIYSVYECGIRPIITFIR